MQKAEFNVEAAILAEEEGDMSQFLISTTATTSSHEAHSEWGGVVKTIKQLFTEEA